MDVDLSTQMSKDNNGWVFEYSELDQMRIRIVEFEY